MRGWAGLLVIGLIFLAGCTEEGNGRPMRLRDLEARPTVEAPPTTSAPTKVAPVVHKLDLAKAGFADSLRHYRITAAEPVRVHLQWVRLIASYGPHDNCLAGMVRAPSGGAGFVAWVDENSLSVRVTAQGQKQEITPLDTGYGFPYGDAVASNFTLATGQSLDLMMGGHDSRVVRAGGFYGRSVMNMTATVYGAHTLEEQPAVPMRCGVGPRQAVDRTAAVEGWFVKASVDGAIEMTTKTASTLLWSDGGGDLTGATLTFLDETEVDPWEFERSVDRPGRIAIAFDHWVELFGSSNYWFMADAAWPLEE